MIPRNEIKQSDIYKACIVLSVIGLATIHISQSYMTPTKADIGEIDETWLGQTVKVNGTVETGFETDNAAFMTLTDSTGTIDLVDFDNQNISENSSVIGHVDIYQGDLQIVLDDVNSAE